MPAELGAYWKAQFVDLELIGSFLVFANRATGIHPANIATFDTAVVIDRIKAGQTGEIFTRNDSVAKLEQAISRVFFRYQFVWFYQDMTTASLFAEGNFTVTAIPH